MQNDTLFELKEINGTQALLQNDTLVPELEEAGEIQVLLFAQSNFLGIVLPILISAILGLLLCCCCCRKKFNKCCQGDWEGCNDIDCEGVDCEGVECDGISIGSFGGGGGDD